MPISSRRALHRIPFSPRRNSARVTPAVGAVVCAAGLAGTLVLTGCGTDDTASVAATTNPACTAAPSPAPVITGPLSSFDLTGVADVTRVYQDEGFFVMNASAAGPITDLTTQFFTVVDEAGYTVAGSDDEGFEAEIFFANGQVAAGQVILTEAACPGVVDVKITLLDNPAVLPSDESSEAPTTTTS